METKLGVRLVNRTTRSIAPTEAGARLLERLTPALGEIEAALDVVNAFRDRPAGTLRINVPATVARLVLPPIVPPFLKAYPDIRLEVVVEDSFVDVLAAGCDAGIRYDERLEQDMIAVPIGPRVQRFATAASPAYLDRAGPAGASARSARPRVPARPIRQRRDAGLGVRARRRGRAGGPWRSARRAARRGDGPRGRTRRSPGSASSTLRGRGCAPISTAAPWSRCWRPGGKASRGRSSTIPAAAICPRRCGPSWTSSKPSASKIDRQPRLVCHCEERSDEAIRALRLALTRIASLTLAMRRRHKRPDFTPPRSTPRLRSRPARLSPRGRSRSNPASRSAPADRDCRRRGGRGPRVCASVSTPRRICRRRICR